MTCYIIDDEQPAINILKDFIEKTPGLELLGTSTEPLQALSEISGVLPPDLLFLDVDMPEINGLDLAALVNPSVAIVFTTGYRDYAVEAFEKEAADYLVKPIFYERFLHSVQRVRLGTQAGSGISPQPETALLVSTGVRGKYLRIPFADISYIQGADAYIEIYSKNGKVMTYWSLTQALKHLPLHAFTRIHKSYIIRDALVQLIEPGQITLQDGTRLPLGPAYRETFRQKMGTPPGERP